MAPHLDTNAISEVHKRSTGLSAVNGFNHPEFCDAGVTDTTVSNRGTVFGVLFVGYRARADDSAGPQFAGIY